MKIKLSSQFLVGLDVGTAEIKAVVAENRNGRPAIVGVFREPSIGLRKGAVVDVAEVSGAVAKVLGEVKQLARPALKRVYVNIGSHQAKAQISRGIVAVSRADSEIYQDDIDRVIKASQAVNLAPNRMVVHTVTREYIVDGVADIQDPLGLAGNRLEISSVIVDAFAPHVKSIMRAVELSGGRISGLVLDPLAASRAVLSKHQRDLGVLLVDLGFGTTSMVVYEENKLSGLAVFPVGSGNVTNDLAVGLKIPVSAAESLKLHYGYALASEVNAKENIDLRKLSSEIKGTVSRRFVSEIIEMRLAEILEFVQNELRLLKKVGRLAGGVVITGGGAKLPGMTELAKQVLKLTSQIGCAQGEEWSEETPFSETFEDPAHVTALGLVLWGADQEGWSARGPISWNSAKDLLKYFLP